MKKRQAKKILFSVRRKYETWGAIKSLAEYIIKLEKRVKELEENKDGN